MAMIASWVRVDGAKVLEGLQEAAEKLETADGELVLDFASVCRIDPNALRAMESFVSAADGKSVKVVLRSVNVDVYKVLKLVKLARRFSFVS
jgi:anti-anti-sigma regulatory factor